MIHRGADLRASVDVVIPVYGERQKALEATLSACLNQTYSVSTIFVVDDGSPEPVSLPEWTQSCPQIRAFRLIRAHRNSGISAARNSAIAFSEAEFVACINVEILPDPDWLATCEQYLSSHPGVGACFTRTVPQEPRRILTRWRLRFQESRYAESSGPSPFAPGHAVLFRKKAVDLVGGYDVRYRRHHEDSDICQRMRKSGWETHYVAESRCTSIQVDTLKLLAGKQLRDTGWYSPAESSLADLYFGLSKWTLIRAGRNLVKGRLYFIPIDVAIWATALWMATVLTFRFVRSPGPRVGSPSLRDVRSPVGEASAETSNDIPRKGPRARNRGSG
jgi:cellulose synthase/poly-beta-1,6-N-acetylglucosamine synthase-like glycosyltransferase